jgi:hypothetical protein
MLCDTIGLRKIGVRLILQEQPMKALLRTLAVLGAIIASGFSPAAATGFCGPGCHITISGACVVDGWGTGTSVRNECPVTTRARPPCPIGYEWKPRQQACGQTVKDWIGPPAGSISD